MKSLGSAEIKNIKEKLMIFKNELIRKNRIKKNLDNADGNIKCKDIKDIRYSFSEEDIYNGINHIKYLFNKNGDYYEDKIRHKESPFKSIIEDITRGLYYVEKMNNLSTSDIKNIQKKFS